MADLPVGADRAAGSTGAIRERDVLDSLPRAVVVTDVAGNIVLWNQTAEMLYGWDEAEAVGRPVFELLVPPDALSVNRTDFDHACHGCASSGDRLVVGRDGQILRVYTHVRPVLDAAGNVVAIVAASEDVGATRAQEQQARDVLEHFRLALDAGGLGTWRWDLASGVTLWDERLESLFGLAPGGFDGTYDMYVSMLHPDDRASVVATVDEAVRTKSRYRTEHRVVWPDGTIRWISGAGGVTLDEDGFVTGTVGCVIDATEQVAEIHERERLATAELQAHERERIQRERLEVLSAINDALNASTTGHQVMQNVTRATVPIFADWCAIHVLPSRSALVPDVEVAHVDPEMVEYAQQLQDRFPYDPTADKGIPNVIRTGQTEFYPDISDDVITSLEATPEERAVIEQLALRSSIAVPLIKQGHILGAMQFVMSSSSRRYTPDDVALAHALAGRIASSLENHRLHDHQRKIATTLQRSLLPATLPVVPQLELAVRYWAAGEANEVGGDFYDVFAVDTNQRWAFVIGDVCGSGPAAAALTGLARHTIRASAWHGDTPVEILTTLNRAVQRSETNSFLTASFGVITVDGVSAHLTLANAGHPLPVLVRDGSATALGTPGTLLGVLDSLNIEAVTQPLHEGDVLVFYTDGATDVPKHSLDERQWAELVSTAAGSPASAEDIADNIRDALASEFSFEERNDDIALVIVKVLDT